MEKVGSGVTEFDEGDHVFVMTGNGCFAEKLVADQSRVQKIPKEMDLQVAAGLAMTYGTPAASAPGMKGMGGWNW